MIQIDNELNELITKWKDSIKGLELMVVRFPTALTLHLLYIPLSSRGKGNGGKIIQELSAYCDHKGLTLKLTPIEDYGTPVEKLRDFVAHLGFQPVVGGDMVRNPILAANPLKQWELPSFP